MKDIKYNNQKFWLAVGLVVIFFLVLFKEVSLSEAISILAVIIAGISVKVALDSNRQQQKDIEKSNRYQRNTFELQNTISQNNLMIEQASKIISNITAQETNAVQAYGLMYSRQYYLYCHITFSDNIAKEMYDQQAVQISKLRETLDVLSNEFQERITEIRIHLNSSKYLKSLVEITTNMSNIISEIEHDISELAKLPSSEEPNFEFLYQYNKNKNKRLAREVSQFQDIFINLKEEEQKKLIEILNSK